MKKFFERFARWFNPPPIKIKAVYSKINGEWVKVWPR